MMDVYLEDDWPEDDRFLEDPWDIENLCVDCGRQTCAELCCECGLPICPMCAETGVGFCSQCPTEDFTGWG